MCVCVCGVCGVCGVCVCVVCVCVCVWCVCVCILDVELEGNRVFASTALVVLSSMDSRESDWLQ